MNAVCIYFRVRFSVAIQINTISIHGYNTGNAFSILGQLIPDPVIKHFDSMNSCTTCASVYKSGRKGEPQCTGLKSATSVRVVYCYYSRIQLIVRARVMHIDGNSSAICCINLIACYRTGSISRKIFYIQKARCITCSRIFNFDFTNTAHQNSLCRCNFSRLVVKNGSILSGNVLV